MTNPLHYPSVPICIQITKLWFPKTEKSYISEDNINFIILEWEWIVCPSVMELLDALPSQINEYYLSIIKQDNDEYDICYQELFVSWELHNTCGALPNALAEMYLWLKENNYLTK